MVDSQPMEEGAQRAGLKGMGAGLPEGPSEPAPFAQETHSLDFVKENINVLITMIKELDQQTKSKATPQKLAYDESKGGGLSEEAKDMTKQLSHESFSTSEAHTKNCSLGKNQRNLSHGKALSQPRRSKRLQSQSMSKEKLRRGRTKSRGRKPKYQEISSDFESEEGLEYNHENLNEQYKRPEPTPFTVRITCFKYHLRSNLPRNITVYDRNKDPEDHLSIFSAAAKQEEWPML
ncbi:hypothetical protein Tco_0947817 [Tanacetum coccineum]